jgi:hypothetical protein
MALAVLAMLFVSSAVKNANRLLPAPPPVAARKVYPDLSDDMTLATWLARCSPPDSIISSDELKPRPRLPARVLHYSRQGFRAVFMCGYHESSDEKLPPYEEWRLNRCYDDDETGGFWKEWTGRESPSLWDGSEKSEGQLFFLFPHTGISLDEVAKRIAKDAVQP